MFGLGQALRNICFFWFLVFLFGFFFGLGQALRNFCFLVVGLFGCWSIWLFCFVLVFLVLLVLWFALGLVRGRSWGGVSIYRDICRLAIPPKPIAS